MNNQKEWLNTYWHTIPLTITEMFCYYDTDDIEIVENLEYNSKISDDYIITKTEIAAIYKNSDYRIKIRVPVGSRVLQFSDNYVMISPESVFINFERQDDYCTVDLSDNLNETFAQMTIDDEPQTSRVDFMSLNFPDDDGDDLSYKQPSDTETSGDDDYYDNSDLSDELSALKSDAKLNLSELNVHNKKQQDTISYSLIFRNGQVLIKVPKIDVDNSKTILKIVENNEVNLEHFEPVDFLYFWKSLQQVINTLSWEDIYENEDEVWYEFYTQIADRWFDFLNFYTIMDYLGLYIDKLNNFVHSCLFLVEYINHHGGSFIFDNSSPNDPMIDWALNYDDNFKNLEGVSYMREICNSDSNYVILREPHLYVLVKRVEFNHNVSSPYATKFTDVYVMLRYEDYYYKIKSVMLSIYTTNIKLHTSNGYEPLESAFKDEDKIKYAREWVELFG